MPEKRVRGVYLIIHHHPTDSFLFFQRDDIPDIPFPGMVDLIGGHIDEGEKPEDAMRRELAEELVDTATDKPYRPEGILFFKQYINEQGIEENIFGLEIDNEKPSLQINEGQGLVWLSRKALGQTDFAFGFKTVILEYADKLRER